MQEPTKLPPLLRTFAAQSGGAIFNALVSFGLTLALARALGSEGFGDYIAVLGFATLALIAIEGGWPVRVYRESIAVPGRPSPAPLPLVRAGVTHTLLVGVALVTGAAASSMSPALPYAIGCMTLVALMNLVSGRLRGAGRFRHEAAWQMAGRSASALAILGTIWWVVAEPRWVFLAWAAGLATVLLAGSGAWLPAPGPIAHGTQYRAVLPFMAIEALSVVLFRMDVALLSVAGLPDRALSDYAACTRFNEAALLLCAPATNVLLRSSRQRHADPLAFAALNRPALAAAGAIGGVAFLGSVAFGDSVMTLLFGTGYASAGALLHWTALGLVFTLPTLVAVQAMVARNGERQLILALAAGALLLVAGFSFGSTFDGARGAAIGAAVAHAATLALVLWLLQLGGNRR